MKNLRVMLIVGPIVAVNCLFAQNDVLTEIRDVSPEEIAVEGFRLDRDQEIEINSVGFRSSGRRGFTFTRAWILDSRTREVVWDLEDADSDRRSRRLVEFRDRVRLLEGEYEVYFAAFPGYVSNQKWGDFFGRIFQEMFNDENDDERYDEFRESLRSFNLVVRGRGKRYDGREVERLRDVFKEGAFISMTGLRDDEVLEQGFELKRPADVHIYAVGEVTRDGTYDYGWIINADTREKVWKMDYRNSDHAGGAQKNRQCYEVISLRAGRYVASFVTDGSHSFHGWNQPPPYDPAFWGMTLKVEEPRIERYVDTFDYEAKPRKNVIVDMTRLRDGEFESRGFTLNKNLNLHIYAIGEGRDGDMFDYGWIVDTKSHKKVWEMRFRDTEHAGGGDKNRLFDRVIPFRKGNYVAYFVTDDSHSYWDWNTAAPHDKDGWGLTISVADDRFRESDVEEYVPSRDKSILAQLVRVGESERERARFSLRNDATIRIYAIGEGQNGTMYDYGWIEDADSRRVVWEMTYRMTDHAGGGKKNRLFDGMVFLRKGEYIVYFESDRGHSFNNWNQDPPYDPMNWGITIYLEAE